MGKTKAGRRGAWKRDWRDLPMLNELLALYDAGLVNRDEPKSMFPGTEIFNERWLLRLVLKKWLDGSGGSKFGFLPFPEDARAYSEGQLYTPFRGGAHRERNTHVDGIVGDFSIPDTKSGIRLNSGMSYIAAFESKLYSALSPGVRYAPAYDQLSRTAACLINSILRADPKPGYVAHVVVVRAKDNRHIKPDKYRRDRIGRTIADRLAAFTPSAERSGTIERFTAGWKEVLENVEFHFLTWEEVVAYLSDDGLTRFYDQCKESAGG
jgi:hypothetical protein